MSLTFTQINTLIETNTGANSVTYPIATKTVDINLAQDRVLALIFKSGNKWRFDDSNHTDYPILTTNLVSGQRDYSFTSDEQGNLILDIDKVMVADASGTFQELTPMDQTEKDPDMPITMTDGENTTGTPTHYSITGNGIFLDLIPSYSYTGGVKIYIKREGYQFTVSDTTKKPGFNALFHEYLALRPSYFYAMRHGLANTNALKNEMLEMEDAIINHYSARGKEFRRRFTANVENNQ